ncbi:hypothetical protein AG1IA_06394 [Rhizoctonia solani AG-1 IA]|uniref:Uncharacterized protein n=1 Tax=Thanatephorus cucumeris (strain AG1-IA) TaxID=983506 RepID=L8WS53_THACA|nr:hypothetical protein AG1IA_06394 [Rhizoctonia solani AG-1 IA]
MSRILVRKSKRQHLRCSLLLARGGALVYEASSWAHLRLSRNLEALCFPTLARPGLHKYAK